MRIISGKHKGRRINAPKKLPARPTTDMAKEALFNILNNDYYFDEITVIDLFAGIGSISLEFASRGTKNIISVDSHAGCIRFINDMARQLDVQITTLKSDVFSYLEKTQVKADIIFADPPYELSKEKFTKIKDLVFENNLLKNDGLLILEHSSHTDLSDLEFLAFEKKYGSSIFSFFKTTS
ncbi:MAG: methyltransferase [Flavobacteriaceae bacterium]|nr:methyltransferase [Flavobacteriaceae bacterium]